MSIHLLTRKQFIPISLEQAWPFFSTPRNLEAITPGFLNFRITSAVPEEIYSGLIITYQISAVAGVPMTWVTEIKHVVPLHRFVDEQRIGPFRFWFHEHRFEAVPGGIEMTDIVHYVMPWSWLGELVHAVFIRRRLNAIFDFRHDYIANLWPS
ncbi:MAG: SRPBCC family protein [Methylococcaceae bacterium]|jgi:ligand-binding SRPBCC domain-containing protein|nr:SRPBCC family protein [Methylococcaceae bacterium]